jgi:hypothetical protein
MGYRFTFIRLIDSYYNDSSIISGLYRILRKAIQIITNEERIYNKTHNIQIISNNKILELLENLEDNKDTIKDLDITLDKFKQLIKTKISDSMIIFRGKSSKGAFDIKGIKIKEKSIENQNDLTIEVELEENLDAKINTITKKKIIKKKEKEYFFDEVVDNKVLLDYQDLKKDILIISKENNIKTWQVVSILMKHGVIVKRDQSRGYTKYKETDEYKNNFKYKI